MRLDPGEPRFARDLGAVYGALRRWSDAFRVLAPAVRQMDPVVQAVFLMAGRELRQPEAALAVLEAGAPPGAGSDPVLLCEDRARAVRGGARGGSRVRAAGVSRVAGQAGAGPRRPGRGLQRRRVWRPGPGPRRRVCACVPGLGARAAPPGVAAGAARPARRIARRASARHRPGAVQSRRLDDGTAADAERHARGRRQRPPGLQGSVQSGRTGAPRCPATEAAPPIRGDCGLAICRRSSTSRRAPTSWTRSCSPTIASAWRSSSTTPARRSRPPNCGRACSATTSATSRASTTTRCGGRSRPTGIEVLVELSALFPGQPDAGARAPGRADPGDAAAVPDHDGLPRGRLPVHGSLDEPARHGAGICRAPVLPALRPRRLHAAGRLSAVPARCPPASGDRDFRAAAAIHEIGPRLGRRRRCAAGARRGPGCGAQRRPGARSARQHHARFLRYQLSVRGVDPERMAFVGRRPHRRSPGPGQRDRRRARYLAVLRHDHDLRVPVDGCARGDARRPDSRQPGLGGDPATLRRRRSGRAGCRRLHRHRNPAGR